MSTHVTGNSCWIGLTKIFTHTAAQLHSLGLLHDIGIDGVYFICTSHVARTFLQMKDQVMHRVVPLPARHVHPSCAQTLDGGGSLPSKLHEKSMQITGISHPRLWYSCQLVGDELHGDSCRSGITFAAGERVRRPKKKIDVAPFHRVHIPGSSESWNWRGKKRSPPSRRQQPRFKYDQR